MIKVCKKKCDQCLFTPNRIVSKGRKREVLKDTEKKNTFFVCHKHKDIACRGWAEWYAAKNNTIKGLTPDMLLEINNGKTIELI